jgi:ABC-2 type transport system permease protein
MLSADAALSAQEKLMVTPTPRAALVSGKAFAAGVRGLIQATMVLVLAAMLRVVLTPNLKLISAAVILVLRAGFLLPVHYHGRAGA